MMYRNAPTSQNPLQTTGIARAQGLPALQIGLIALVFVAALAALFLMQAHAVGDPQRPSGTTGDTQSVGNLSGYASSGGLVSLSGVRYVSTPDASQPFAARTLYIPAYDLNWGACTSRCGAQMLPSGYTPQCDPCFLPGLQPQFAYHDMLLTAAQLADLCKDAWQPVLLVYDPALSHQADFKPLTSAGAVVAAEKTGEFLQIGQGANPYEVTLASLMTCSSATAR